MKKFLKENKVYILIILLAVFIRQTRLIGINIVSGASMMPTLEEGQILFGSSIKKLERGDIVVAKTNKLVIKRLIGLPNEKVESIDGIIYIDGEKLEEDYVKKERNVVSSRNNWSYTLGDSEYLIIGDNRDNSYDSRMYGPLPANRILEKIYTINKK